MSPSEQLNEVLCTHHKAAFACLSATGRRMFFPKGIPAQAAEAKTARINATIGQLTDGRGHALPLPAISDHLVGVSLEDATLYTPQGGNLELREAWRQRLQRAGQGPMSLPFCTVGLTHGLSLLAELFVDEDTDVLLPSPNWGNYNHIFGVKMGGRLHSYPVFRDGVFDRDAIETALEHVQKKAVLILNFPGNPTGYTPTPEELAPWLDAIRRSQKPVVVICDDAYAGFVYEDGLLSRSPFHDLADAPTDRVLTVKVDGATKELCFFGGRVGFVTFAASGQAADALDTKLKGIARASVSTAPAVSQALVLSALGSPDLARQQQERLDESAARFRQLKAAIARHRLEVMPFNSGFFALLTVKGDPERLRQRLLDRGIGVIAMAQHSAIRVAFSSTAMEDIDHLIDIIADELRGAP